MDKTIYKIKTKNLVCIKTSSCQKHIKFPFSDSSVATKQIGSSLNCSVNKEWQTKFPRFAKIAKRCKKSAVNQFFQNLFDIYEIIVKKSHISNMLRFLRVYHWLLTFFFCLIITTFYCISQQEISLNQYTLQVNMRKSSKLLGREPVINIAFKKLTIAVTKNNS